MHQVYKCNMKDLQQSETLKAIIKESGAKPSADIRVNVATVLRAMDGFMLAIKRTAQQDNFRDIQKDLSSQMIDELNILIEQVSFLEDKHIAGVNDVVRNYIQSLKTQ